MANDPNRSSNKQSCGQKNPEGVLCEALWPINTKRKQNFN